MKPKIDYLGKVSCTVSKDYWSSEKDYDKLTIVEKEGVFGTFISRKPVLAGTPLTNREFWIPFSSVKESIVLDYNSFKDKYDKQLNDYKISLSDVISRLKTLEESKTDIDDLIEIANTALYKANNALTAVANINNKLAKPNGIATLDSTGKVPLTQLPNNIGGGNNLELGETSTTAYPGDKGKKNANAISSLTNALDSIDSYSKTTRNQLDAFKNTKGQALGIVPLDENGKVSSSYLPSYVDDVLEYNTRTTFPTTGESGKIYIALDTNKTYRWGGTTYVELKSNIALGETSSTAYAGDKGKKNREDINNLTTSVTTLSNNLNDVTTKATNNATNIENLTEDLGNTQGLLSNHIQDFKDYKQINAGIAEQVTELNTEVTTLKSNQSKFNTSLADVRSSFNNYASAKTPIIDKVEPHIADKQNPHEVTKAQVGLSNVTNDAQVKRSEMGANNGVATLDSKGKVLESQLPAGVTSSLVLGETEGTAYDGSKGANHEASFSAFNSFDVFSFTPTSNTNNSGFTVYAEKLYYDKYPSSLKYPILNKRGPYTIISIPVANSTKTSGCGLLLNTDKKKLDGLFSIAGGLQDIDVANPTNNGITLGLDYCTFNKDTGETSTNTRNIYIPVADATKANGSGLMLNSDKTKLDSLSNYTLPTADSTTLGGIKIGSGLNIDSNGIVSVDNKLYILVNSLESVSTPDANKIYLVLNSSSTSETNSFTEYVWITSDTGSKWEKLGEASATVDLADYYNKTEINNKLSSINNSITELDSNKVDKQDVATTAKNGLLSKEDKTKLDGIETGANKYVLPEAGNNTLGGIKAAPGTAGQTVSTINTKFINQKEVCGSFIYHTGMEQVYPTYSQVLEATTEKYGLMSPEDKVKLNNINVTDSEYLNGTIEVRHSGNSFNLECQRVKFSNYDDYEYYDINIPVATNSACGLLSKEDKVKLDNLSSGGSSAITWDHTSWKSNNRIQSLVLDSNFLKFKEGDKIKFGSADNETFFNNTTVEIKEITISKYTDNTHFSFGIVLAKDFGYSEEVQITCNGTLAGTSYTEKQYKISTNCPTYIHGTLDNTQNTITNCTLIILPNSGVSIEATLRTEYHPKPGDVILAEGSTSGFDNYMANINYVNYNSPTPYAVVAIGGVTTIKFLITPGSFIGSDE